MASIDDLARISGNRGALANRPQLPEEGLRTYTPEQMSQLGGSQSPPRLGAPSSVPAIQAPMYSPESPPRLGAVPTSPIAQVGESATAASPGIGIGPLARAAGMAAKGLGIGAIAHTALSAIDPNDSAGSWIDKNVPGASFVDNAASKIGLGRSYAEQGAAGQQPTIAGVGRGAGIIPPAAAATLPQTGGASGDWETPPQSSPTQDAEMRRIQSQAAPAAGITTARTANGPLSVPMAGAQTQQEPQAPLGAGEPVDALAQQQNPISFITYGGGQGGNGTSGTQITNKDGTQSVLQPGQTVPDEFNALNKDAAQSQSPVQVIRGMQQTTAIPNGQGNPMQEVPQDVANGGSTAVNGFLAARQQNALNQADPLKAATDAKIREQMVMQGMGDPSAPGAASMGATAGMTGDDYLKSLQPARSALIKSIIGGGMQVSPFIIAKNPGLMAQVAQADPSFDVKDINARSKLQSSFKAGPDAANILSLNTAMAHIAHLNDHMTALNNGNRAWANSAENWIGDNVIGNRDLQKRLSAVGTDAKGVAGEMAKVFRSSGMSEHEISDWKNSFTTATTPASQQGTIEAAMGLLKGRMDALGQKYATGMGPQATPYPILSKDNQAAFDRLSGSAPTPTSSTPAATQSAPPQAAAAHLQAHPELRAQFEAKYGAGSAASVLGQ